MSGNVAEWCYDIYGDIAIDTEPTGAKDGEYRVFRGGQYAIGSEDSCVGIRSTDKTDFVLPALGFRVVYTIKKQKAFMQQIVSYNLLHKTKEPLATPRLGYYSVVT